MKLLGLAVVSVCVLAACATGGPAAKTPGSVSPVPPQKPTVASKPLSQPSAQSGERQAYEKISAYVQQGEPDKAIATFIEAGLSNPNDTKSQFFLANLYLSAQRFKDAKAVLERILAADPGNIQATYDLALAAGGLGDTAKQESLLQKVIAAAPDNSSAHASLGEIYLESQQYGRAMHSFQESLKSDPNNVVALVGLGTAYMYQGELNHADTVLSKAIEVAPGFSFAYVNRGRERADNGNFAAAEKDLNEAVRLDPTSPWHYIDRGRIRARAGNPSGAVSDFTKAIELDPQVFLTYVYRGQVYERMGKQADALSDYRKALSLRPDYYPVYSLAGALYFEDRRWDQAAEMFRKAFTAVPTDFGYPLIAALSYKYGGNEKLAQSYLKGELGKISQDPLYYAMARFYLEPHNDSGVFRQIMDLKDQLLKAKMLFFLGAQYDLNGQKDLAQTVLLEVPKQNFPQLIESRLADWILKSQEAAKK